jgi:hypothetical protein
MSISPDYADVLKYLRAARSALAIAGITLDLIGPSEPKPGALADLVETVRGQAELIHERT